MGAWAELNNRKTMTTRWRRRQICVLEFEGGQPAVIRSVSASAMFLETNARPPLGDAVALRHPDAGAVVGRVHALHADGVALRLDGSEAAMAFALAAIAADMSEPG